MHWILLLAAVWLLGFALLWALVYVGARGERAEAAPPLPQPAPRPFAQPRHA